MDDFRTPFFSKIARQGECIVWTGSLRRSPKGYGCLRVGGKTYQAHRVSWFIKYNYWPKQLNHRCHNPACVRLSHLYEGTQKQNMDDMWTAGQGLCGEAKGKLTEEQVREIRELCKTRLSLNEIGRRFGIDPGNVSEIHRGRFWGRLDPDRSITRKPYHLRSFVEINGEVIHVEEAARRAGVSRGCIEKRVISGLTGEALLRPKYRAPRKPYIRRN